MSDLSSNTEQYIEKTTGFSSTRADTLNIERTAQFAGGDCNFLIDILYINLLCNDTDSVHKDASRQVMKQILCIKIEAGICHDAPDEVPKLLQ